MKQLIIISLFALTLANSHVALAQNQDLTVKELMDFFITNIQENLETARSEIMNEINSLEINKDTDETNKECPKPECVCNCDCSNK